MPVPETEGTSSDSTPVRAFAAVADRIATWSGRLAGVALVLICLLVATEVTMRNVFNRSTMMADEMCSYLNVALVFFGLSYTLQQGGFIRVDTVHGMLKGAIRRIVDWYSVLVSLVFTTVVFYYVATYTLYSYRNNIRSAEVSETPQFIPQLFMVFGVAALIIYLLKLVAQRCRNVP
jgi:TRAP-type C4-dicarboxylate transport system permease small subunit